MNATWSRNTSPSLLLSAIVCVLIYSHGLGGDFVFDDFPNIVTNSTIIAASDGTPDWFKIAFQTGSGLLRRPISMLSFGFNAYWFGMNPLSFKVVNLIIHLANGLLLYLLVSRIVHRLTRSLSASATTIALVATAAWLLHPLQVSSVLYAVQRMNLLSTMFLLAGLLCYANGRLRMIAETRGTLLAFGGVLLFGVLAVLCKENGALVVGYALVIEIFCFQFDGTARDRQKLEAFFLLTVALPLLGLTVYYIRHPEALQYARNGFTLYTRLLSESRVLCDYLVWIFVPLPAFMGLYHDDILVSAGLFSPISTFVCILFLLLLCVTAWMLRRRYPAFGFGIAWFIVGQSLESTIFPLELVFEHRNYLPMAGPLVAAIVFAFSARAARQTSWLACAALLLLAATTLTRANDWSSGLALAMSDANHHPLSSRSQYEAGRMIASTAAKNNRLDEERPRAIEYLQRAAQLGPNQVFPLASIILLRGTTISTSQEEVLDLERRLKNAESNEQANAFLDVLVTASDGKLGLTSKDIAGLMEAALSNPRWRPQVRGAMFNDYGAYMFNIVRNQQQAISLTMMAATIEPNNPYYELNLAKIGVAVGNRDVAIKHLQTAERLDVVGIYKNDFTDIEKQISTMSH